MAQLTHGNINRQLISLSVPLLAGNILQQLYNTVDAVIVGRFAGDAAFAYHLFSGVLRAVGNTRATLFFLALSMGANLVLDLGLVAGLSMGVAGAALATVLAQALATGLGWIGVVTFWTALVWKELYKPLLKCRTKK